MKCNDFIGGATSLDPSVDNEKIMDVVAGHDPSGTSTKNIVHFK